MPVSPALVFSALDIIVKLYARYPQYKKEWDAIRKNEGITDAEWESVKNTIENHRPDFTHADEIEPGPV